VTFQRKLLLGFSLMSLPALLIAGEALRTNALERRALQTLGQNMARNGTYTELKDAMFNQSEIIWRALTGMDATAEQEFRLNSEVVDYWLQRWRSELRPNELGAANRVHDIEQQFQLLAARVFALCDSGQRAAAYRLAQTNLRDGLLPAFTDLNREIYRQARESSVRGAYARLEDIVADEGRALLGLLILVLGSGLAASWIIARGVARPINELRNAMGVVGADRLDYPIDVSSRDEIGDLARSFAAMTENLRQSRAAMVRLNGELEAKVAELERAQAQLVQSEKLASIGEMSAAVAHGLRNPLASLRAAAQLALRHTESSTPRDHLRLIIEEVDRLDRRISHLLSFSRPAPYHPMPESVTRLVEDLLPPFTQLLRERGIELDVALSPNLPDVRVDPMQVEQALVEVVSNALDAMSGGGRLRIDARREDGATNLAGGVIVEITDTGGGIPESVLPTVCEPFVTTRPEGTGLGLAIAKRYVEQNGGRLEIVSRVGSGTTVRIRLPATK
jgi:signal transduction histidine kinase